MSDTAQQWRVALEAAVSGRGWTLSWESERVGSASDGLHEARLEVAPQGAGEHSDTVRREAWIGGWLDGLAAGWSSPQLDAHATFADVAGVLVPRLDVVGFVHGFEAASGHVPFTQPWADGLVLTYWLELDLGAVVLTGEVVRGWGVTDDRVTCGARSILFHRTQQGAVRPHAASITCYAQEDGYDSGRVAVIEDHQWGLSRQGLWLGVPSRDLLLFRIPGEAGELEAFRAATSEAHAQAACPLSDAVFRLIDGRIERVDALIARAS